MSGTVPILIIDDERAIRKLLATALRRDGFDPVEASDAREALSLAAIVRPAAALVDLGLPDRDGLELIQPLAEQGACAVIVISAREQTQEKVDALDLGADDYVTKPFDTEELLARLRAALRRRAAGSAGTTVVRAGSVEIDLAARIVRRDGSETRLTAKEWALLAELARHPDRILTHAQILKAVWGPAHEKDVEYLRVTARSLRLKLEANPSQPVLIRNEPGIGYRLVTTKDHQPRD